MKYRMIAVAAFMLAAGCSTAPAMVPSTEVETLKARIASLEADNKLGRLKLADEMERADVQLYLTRQEIATAKRETATVKAKCGAPCADKPAQ